MTTIVMTGGSSGLGLAASRCLLRANARLILGSRGVGPDGAQVLPLDLLKLTDVRRFVSTVEQRLGLETIDALVLNAGGYARERSADGHDGTFVLTTSGTHDPAENTIVPPPRHANALWLANPELDPSADTSPRTANARAYSSSKLCVVLLARGLLARSQAEGRRVRVVAYDPGPTPGTGLVRQLSPVVRFFWGPLATPLRWMMRGANTVEDAGLTLAALALGELQPPEKKLYVALRRGKPTTPALSELARRDDLMDTLWRDSAALVGLT